MSTAKYVLNTENELMYNIDAVALKYDADLEENYEEGYSIIHFQDGSILEVGEYTVTIK